MVLNHFGEWILADNIGVELNTFIERSMPYHKEIGTVIFREYFRLLSQNEISCKLYRPCRTQWFFLLAAHNFHVILKLM
jgi:hypothetical protein